MTKMIDDNEYEYHMEKFKNCDPDYVVDVLEITTEELISAFPYRATKFIEEEYGDV